MDLKRLGVLGVSAVLLITACNSGGSGGTGGGGTAVKIGIELPMTGGEAPNGVPTANGVQLALKQITVNGYTVTIEQEDDAVNGVHNADQGAKNMQTLANDPAVIGVVGPFNSSVAQAEIPVSNAAGLMQCSPANTNPGLTQGDAAKALRQTNPDKIAYVRVATTDLQQGAAGADIAFNVVGAKTAYVLDDTQTYGKGIADVFAQTFTSLGGTVVGRDGVSDTTTDFTSYVTKIAGLKPDYVYYGGVTTSGLGLFRKQMDQQGLSNIPFGGGDGINDGSAATASSFLNIVGASGDANTYSTVAAVHDIPNASKFSSDYMAQFNSAPGAYSAPAYACAQVILQALGAAGGITDLAKLREAVRSYIATPSNTYDTVLGTISFDANGDTSQHTISYYKYDATAKDWVFFKQRDLTADPLTGGASPSASQ
ncbi:MAG TPA: branched-chain amino acid ABC transporter substrate-binding protein [Candidatus Sulfotelmatobacter sp.]|nr:branched-chain amino acid ABC transporter substrate-binding protein [Candidatus Sulfotelmatobacter sp.]